MGDEYSLVNGPLLTELDWIAKFGSGDPISMRGVTFDKFDGANALDTVPGGVPAGELVNLPWAGKFGLDQHK